MSSEEKEPYYKESGKGFEDRAKLCVEAGVKLRARPSMLSNMKEETETEMSSQTPAPLPTTQLALGKFEVLGPAKGFGTFGTVFQVKHADSHRLFACKLEPVLHTLDHELKILQKIGSHPSFLPVIDNLLEVGGLSWFVMDLVPTSLSSFLTESALDNSSQQALFRQLMSGLGHMHSLKILHGDVKPSNILYNQVSKHFFLIDFGISVYLPLPVSSKRGGESLYTIPYRPPELLESCLLLRGLLKFKLTLLNSYFIVSVSVSV